MPRDQRAILFVHAHPDDESIGSGGALLHYRAAGVRTVVITATRGECGEISDPALATPANLAEVRTRETAEAIAILGVSHHVWLDYRDSGMAGTSDNDNPASFHRADLEEAVGRVVRIVRQERPQVIVSYDPNGSYGHPDHVKAHRVAQSAFWAAGDPKRFPDAGRPWTPAKLYESVMSRSAMERFAELLRDLGVERPAGEEDAMRERVTRYSVPDDQITTVIDGAPYVAEKRRALLAHRTQMGPGSRFARLPTEAFERLWGRESYRRVAGPFAPGPDGREDDLSAGL